MVPRQKDKHEKKLSLESIVSDTSDVDALIRVLCKKAQELPYSKKLLVIFYLKHLIYKEFDTIIIPKCIANNDEIVKDLGDGFVEVRK